MSFLSVVCEYRNYGYESGRKYRFWLKKLLG